MSKLLTPLIVTTLIACSSKVQAQSYTFIDLDALAAFNGRELADDLSQMTGPSGMVYDLGTIYRQFTGVDLTVRANNTTELFEHPNPANGGLVFHVGVEGTTGGMTYTLSQPLFSRLSMGANFLAGEIDHFGPTGSGSLISNHNEFGLAVTNDSVGNIGGSTVNLANVPLWESDENGTVWTIQVENLVGGATTSVGGAPQLFLSAVPEPSSLALVFLGMVPLLQRRRG